MRKTAIYRDDLFLAHDPGPGHPESPERLRVIYDKLDSLENDSIFIYPQFDPASTDIIELNHSSALVKQVAATAGRSHGFLDADTQTSADSYDAACLAVGALIDGIHRLDQGEIDNGFCIVRPPGHHAERDKSMGFCLFNNVAVAARWAGKELGLKRILIVDWDLHHGNGTQHSFYDTDQVLYCSTHQFPYYPGSGAVLECGNGSGAGFTVNVPLAGGQGDLEFARIFNELFAPVARLYQPELILVSCGFDIYDGDPLGSMKVSPVGFAYMTRVMRELAEELCDGKVLITLEGGYNPAGMRDGSLAVLAELCGRQIAGFGLGAKKANPLKNADIECSQLEQAISVQKNYWKI